MSRWMLDTDTASHIIKRRPDTVRRRLNAVGIGSTCVSAVTLGELRSGAARASDPRTTGAAVDDFVRYIEIRPWDEAAAVAYGMTRARLLDAGTPIGALDEMIAAHAIALELTLVTSNRRHFERVEGLSLDTWT